MSAAKQFLDTNVLLYLLSEDLSKAEKAEALISEGGFISVQVLNEFVAVGLKKHKLKVIELQEILDAIRANIVVVPLTTKIHDQGLKLMARYGFSVYDAMIVAAAMDSGCIRLYTEDLQHDQLIDGSLKITNPFLP